MNLFKNQNTIFLIVTFSPDINLLYLINEIKKQSFTFIIVDNSIKQNEFISHIIKDNPKLYFISNNNINGISRAYNEGFKLAINLGYDFVITIDQDSLIGDDLINNYNKCINNINYNTKTFGAIGVSQNKQNFESLAYNRTYELINSGTIISTTAFKNISGYDELYFIDNVDFDFFLRLKLNGYLTYKLSNYSITHKLGIPTVFKILFFKTSLNIYSSERLFYYSFSNIIFLRKNFLKAPLFCSKKLIFYLIYLFKSFFYYPKKELKSILFGIKKAAEITNI